MAQQPTAKERAKHLAISGGLLGAAYGLHKYGDHIEAFVDNKLDAAHRRRTGRAPDEIGGSVEDKLERVVRRARGTPEGTAALHKLTRLRERQGQTVTGKAKKMITRIVTKISPRKVAVAGHLLSAREQLDQVIQMSSDKPSPTKKKVMRRRNRVIKESLLKARFACAMPPMETHLRANDQEVIELSGLPKNIIPRRSTAVAIGDLELLKKSNAERLQNLSHKVGDQASGDVIERIRALLGGTKKLSDASNIIEFDRDRLRGAAKGAAIGSVVGSVLGGSIGRRYGLGRIAALNYGLRGVGAGAVVGAVAARRKKIAFQDQLQDIIELKAVDLGYTYGEMECNPCSAPQKKHYPTLYIHDRENDIDLPLSGQAIIRYKLRSKTTRQNEEGNKRHSADIEIQTIDPVEEPEKAPKEGEKAKLKTLGARRALGEIISFSEGAAVGEGIPKALKELMKRYGPSNRGAGKVVKRVYTPRSWDRVGQIITKPANQAFSKRLDELIAFADPRPRNQLGMFTDANGNDLDPNSMDTVYKTRRTIGQNLAGGAVAGIGAAASGSAVKALFSKLKKARA